MTIADVDLQSIAVMLEFVRPAGTAGRLLGDDWLTRMDESSRRIQWPAATKATQYHDADIRDGCTKKKAADLSGPFLRVSVSLVSDHCTGRPVCMFQSNG